MKKFLPHQEKAYAYSKDRARVAFFMQMRLGKTLVAIRWAERFEPILVIAPRAVLKSWEDELLDEGYAYEDIQTFRGTFDQKMEWLKEPVKWNLINYEGVEACFPVIKQRWDCIILDESTKIKNPAARITKIINKNTVFVPNRAVLTGLPNPESLMDYFEQMKFLYGSFMGCDVFYHFRNKFFYKNYYEYLPTTWGEKKILESLNQLAFTLTRDEAGIGGKKFYERRFVEINAAQKELYNQIADKWAYTYKEETQTTKWVTVRLQWLMRVAGGFTPEGLLISDAKFQELLYLLKNELEKGEPVVVWFKHTCELEYANLFFTEKKYTCSTFYSKNPKGHLDWVEEKTQLLFAQGKCGQYGLDFSRASVSVYFSNWWDGEIRAQTEDRIIHPLSKTSALYIDILTEDTVDPDVQEKVCGKMITAGRIQKELARKWLKNT